MKYFLVPTVMLCLFSCSNSKQEAAKPQTKIICGDSVEQEMFDEQGNAFTVRVPGRCDTVLVTGDEQKN